MQSVIYANTCDIQYTSTLVSIFTYLCIAWLQCVYMCSKFIAFYAQATRCQFRSWIWVLEVHLAAVFIKIFCMYCNRRAGEGEQEEGESSKNPDWSSQYVGFEFKKCAWHTWTISKSLRITILHVGAWYLYVIQMWSVCNATGDNWWGRTGVGWVVRKSRLDVYLYVCKYVYLGCRYMYRQYTLYTYMVVYLYVMQELNIEENRRRVSCQKIQTGRLGWFAEMRPSHLVWWKRKSTQGDQQLIRWQSTHCPTWFSS